LRSWGVNVKTHLVNLIVRASGLDLRTGSEAHLELALSTLRRVGILLIGTLFRLAASFTKLLRGLLIPT